MRNEIWKDIENYESSYQVSNFGNVKSFYKNGNNKTLKLGTCIIGYHIVNLYKNGKRQKWKVHRLVAMAFIPNPENKPQVNHIDGNKLNNCVDNLEWMTASENLFHAHKTGLKAAKKGLQGSASKLSADQVMFIRSNYRPLGKCFTQQQLADRFGVSQRAISGIVRNISYNDV